MTDLLTSLVDRALDRAPVLQRRAPAIFEPVTETAFHKTTQFENASALEEEETTVERASSLDRQRPGRPSQLPTATPQIKEAAPPQAAPPLTARRVRHPNELPDHRSEPRRREAGPTPTTNALNVKPVAHNQQPDRALIPRAIAKAEDVKVEPQRLIETIFERRIEREIISEHVNEPAKDMRAETPFARPPHPAREVEGEQPKRAVKVETKVLTPPQEVMTIKPSAQKLEPRSELRPPLVVPQVESLRALQPPAAPPAVHVTIGRVEVRAMPQPARAPAARPAGPRMSLDDYLQSRGEGK